MNVIEFPRYVEVNFLLKKYNINKEDLSKEQLKEAISEVRKTHGIFDERHFITVVNLISHDWLPCDIPVLLPRGSNK